MKLEVVNSDYACTLPSKIRHFQKSQCKPLKTGIYVATTSTLRITLNIHYVILVWTGMGNVHHSGYVLSYVMLSCLDRTLLSLSLYYVKRQSNT